MGDTTEAERVLEKLSQGCPLPPQEHARPAYRPVEVYDQAGRRWPGTIVAWWTTLDGAETCCLRLFGARAPRWTVFDPDRNALLVQGGT